MNKNTFKSWLLLLAVVFIAGCDSRQKEDMQYNVLLIMADDMNEYGFFKTNPIVKTPYLDKFKETAVSFRNTYCAAPACSPSRTSFLSGTSPHRNGKYYNGSDAWNTPYLQEQESMPEWFKRIGYSSYGKGKLFHSKIKPERVAKNFDGSTGKAGFGPFPDKAHRIDSNGSRFEGVQAFPIDTFPDYLNANTIIEMLQSEQDKPFFMMYGLWRPHSPYTCPQEFLDMYNLEDISIPPGYLNTDANDLPAIAKEYIKTERGSFKRKTSDEQVWKEYLRGYYACYTFADWNIGRVLETLDNSKYAENTIVIITSDNGFHMGEKNRFDKNSLWELSAITPMAIRVPGTKHAGKLCTKPVNLQDLYPTFVDYCGKDIQPLKPIAGHSIRPLLENPEMEWEHPSITFFGKDWVSIRTEQYRYISYPDGTEELYDHFIDNWELNNLAKEEQYIDLKRELKAFIPGDMVEALPGKWTKKIKQVEKRAGIKE